MSVTLYRDYEYGALAVMAEGHRLTIIDHGFADIVPVRGLLERTGKLVVAQGMLDGSEVWHTRANAHVVRENIGQMLREGGYVRDSLAERAILTVELEEATHPDLPASRRAHVSEAVERAVAGHLNTAVASLGALGEVQSQTMEAFTRPNAKPSRLPFIHAQAVVAVGHAFDEARCADVCKQFRGALRPLKEALVRASVALDDGLLFLEAGIRPAAALVEQFEAGALPAFEPAPVRGYRDATLVADALTVEAVDRLRERALACTAALEVEQIEGMNAVRVRIPSVYEDSHTGDPAFSARLNWLASQIAGELSSVGDFCEDVATKTRTTQAVNEAVMAAKNKALVEINSSMGRLSQILDSLDPDGRREVVDTIVTTLQNRADQFIL